MPSKPKGKKISEFTFAPAEIRWASHSFNAAALPEKYRDQEKYLHVSGDKDALVKTLSLSESDRDKASEKVIAHCMHSKKNIKSTIAALEKQSLIGMSRVVALLQQLDAVVFHAGEAAYATKVKGIMEKRYFLQNAEEDADMNDEILLGFATKLHGITEKRPELLAFLYTQAGGEAGVAFLKAAFADLECDYGYKGFVLSRGDKAEVKEPNYEVSPRKRQYRADLF